MIQIALVPWPCGCISAWGDLLPHASWHLAYACPWCGATVSRPDFLLWMKEAQVPPPHIEDPTMLLRVGDSVVETSGECDDGVFVVRSLSGSPWCRLEVSRELVEVLRN